jgi:hypothetical protein
MQMYYTYQSSCFLHQLCVRIITKKIEEASEIKNHDKFLVGPRTSIEAEKAPAQQSRWTVP